MVVDISIAVYSNVEAIIYLVIYVCGGYRIRDFCYNPFDIR